MTKKSTQLQKFENFVIFQTESGKVNIEVFFKDDTLWLTQKKMAELFEIWIPAISKHLKNIFETWELSENQVISILETTASDWKIYQTTFYNLQVILSVGYRINSHRAIEFRKWANSILQDFIVKWYALDDERLKQIKHFWIDYFDDLLERIKEIRMSERRLYQKITDIYALSADYDSKDDITKHFFATVQNKLHWAITWKTAAEIIYSETDATKIYMWLTSWKHSPHWKILKSDVIIAKNYLNEEHIKKLNSLVNSYLDLAESKAESRQIMNMKDWDEYLEKFLELSDKPILKESWWITMLEAKLKAESEYNKYRVIQDKKYQNDFDKEIQKYLF